MKQQELRENAVTILSFAIANSQTEVDDTIIREIQADLAKIDLDNPPSINDVAEASIDILDDLAALTPTTADDKAVSFLRIMFPSMDSDIFSSIRRWWLAGRDRRKAKRQARRDMRNG